MVKAILAGRKTQTRRVKKKNKIPYERGDHLWVRETWRPAVTMEGHVFYAADEEDAAQYKWKPSIFLKRKHSRITLEVLNVRIERVQEITKKDAVAEGFIGRAAFIELWEKLNEPRGFGWGENPFVWVVDFKVIKGG